MKFSIYDVDVTFAGESIMGPGNQKNISIAMVESIHQLLPLSTLDIKDTTGLSFEKLVNVQGMPTTITLGTHNKPSVTYDGILSDLVSKDYDANGVVKGTVEYNLQPASIINQVPKSTAYQGTTSDVIKETMAEHFSSFDVDPSGGQAIYYRNMKTPFKFVNDDLKDKLYALKSNNSPYYVWVDFDNVVHIKNRASLQQKPSVETIYLQKIVHQQQTRNIALDIKLLTKDFNKNVKTFNIQRNSFNHTTGELETVNRCCLKNNPNMLKSHLSMYNSTYAECKTYLRSPKTPGEKDIFLGDQINTQKRLAGIQKLIITLSLSTHIHAGNTIDLVSEDIISGATSATFKDKYLVEEVTHMHNGLNDDPLLYTELIVSRADISPKGYTLAPLLGSYV